MGTGEKDRAGGLTRGRGSARKGIGRAGGAKVLRGPWGPRMPDLTGLQTTTLIAQRGLMLVRLKRVREVALFPGVFHVTGSEFSGGGTRAEVYVVDVRTPQHPTCSCSYFQHRVEVCKHIAAVAGWYLVDGGRGMGDTDGAGGQG